MSKNLNKQFSVIYLNSLSQGGLGFYFLCTFCLVTDTNLSIWLKLVIPISNLNTWIKGVQIQDHERKILNFSDDTTIFLLRDINCHTRIQSIKKSHEIASN